MGDTANVIVQLLGDFRILRGDEILFQGAKIKSNKPLQLLVYILCQPGKQVLSDRLVSSMLVDEECENPKAVYKNLVYRLRKMLVDFEPDESKRASIYYKSGSYCLEWNNDTDFDVFESYLKAAKESTDDEKIWDNCTAALDLYKGDFLGGYLSEYWVNELMVYYQRKYFACLDIFWKQVEKYNYYGPAANYFARAYELYPHEEDIYLRYIQVLYEDNQHSEATRVYEITCQRLFNDFGVAPPDSLQDLMKRLYTSNENVVEGINEVRNSICEMNDMRGAYECTIYEFSRIFHVIVRSMERSGKSVFLMLCTLRENNGELPKTGERLAELFGYLQSVISDTLRAEDVFARYSSTQYVILLPDINYENCGLVASRIRESFYNKARMKKLRLDFKYASAVVFENITI